MWTRSNYYNTWYILSMLIGWKSGTSTCRKIYSAEFSSRTFHKFSLLRRSSLRGGYQKWEKNHRLPNPESLPRNPRLQTQRLLKNMKFEGIEIAQFQIPSSFQISSSISIPSNFIFFKSLCGGESHKFKLQIYATNKKYRWLADNFWLHSIAACDWSR